MKNSPVKKLKEKNVGQIFNVKTKPDLTFLFGFLFMLFCFLWSSFAYSAPCAVSASSLSAARNAFTQQCSAEHRNDCDQLGGVWYCSSGPINGAIPAGLVNGNEASPVANTPPASTSGTAGAAATSNNSTAPVISSGTGGLVCSVAADSRSAAMNEFSRQCASSQRADCDWINGRWYCSSQTIDQNIPAGLVGSANPTTAGTSSGNTVQAVSPANAPQVPAVGSGPCIDSDGDGWGWNGASCRVTSTNNSSPQVVRPTQPVSGQTIFARDITDLVLLTGQSNALGANTSYDAALDSPHDRVFAFTDSGWRRADLHQIWDRGWHPRNHPTTDPSNNLLLHFGKRLVARDQRRVVGFILVSQPGAAISTWDYNSSFYNRVRDRVVDAINQLPHKSQLDGVLWHQGETDALDTPLYGAQLNALIRNFRSEPWFSGGKPFVCGEIAKRGGVNNRLNALNSDGDPWTACVSAQGVATKSDNSHFTAAGLREIGRRYADRFYQMTR